MDAPSEKLIISKDEEDRISELPTCIAGKIVSLLSPKDAAKTSILSRWWRHLHFQLHLEQLHLNFNAASIFSIDPVDKYGNVIDDHPSGMLDLRKSKKWMNLQCEFVTRVDRIMKKYMVSHEKRVVSLRICFLLDNRWSWYLDRWILEAVDSGVEKIQLLFNMGRGKWRQDIIKRSRTRIPIPYDFPYSFFDVENGTNRSLKHLHIRECLMRARGDFRGFSHLTTLVLDSVIIYDVSFVENLFVNCPQLQDLTLASCYVGISKFSVAGPSVRNLLCLRVLACPNLGEIEISTANLTTFEYYGDLDKITCFEAPALETVCFSSLCPDTHISQWLQKFAKLRRLETLNLRIHSLETLPNNIDSFLTFTALKHLSFVIEAHIPDLCDAKGVSFVLRAAPVVQKLHLMFLNGRVHDDYKYYGERDCGPIVLFHQLKELEICGYVGNRYVLELAIAVLKVATMLEKILIVPSFEIYYGNGEFHDIYGYNNGDPLPPGDYLWKNGRKDVTQKILQKYAPPTAKVACLNP